MLYCVVATTSRFVLQMGIRPYAVKVEKPASQELVSLDAEKPTHLSEIYFKVVAGQLIEMNATEKAQAHARVVSDRLTKRVADLKETVEADPAGFKTSLGLS